MAIVRPTAGVNTELRSYEYEAWPRGRIVFGRPRALFILLAVRDRGNMHMA